MSQVWNEIFNTPSYQNLFKEIINTTLDNFSFMEVDRTKVGTPGRTVSVHEYSFNGNPFAVVPEGQSTSTYGTISYETKDYTVETLLGQSRFTQEAGMDLPDVETVLRGYLTNSVKQKVTANVIDAWYGIRNFCELGTGDDKFFDAIAEVCVQLNLEQGEAQKDQLIAYCNPKTYKKIRKEAKGDFKYVEKFAELGEVYVYGGLPIVCIKEVKFNDLETNAVVNAKIEDDNIIVAPKAAVKYYAKEDFRVKLTESEDMRTNILAVNGTFVIALTDSSKAVIIAPELTSTTTMAITDTTLTAEKAAGTCDSGIEVDIYIDGILKETVVAESNAWESTGVYTGSVAAVFHKRGYSDVVID